MPHQITITDDDILAAEKILLPDGEHFDDERRAFIRNFESIDLQACPGSGKTTCLLAKLFILSRHSPFENGDGILVLSHTNAAVDEIKNKIFIHHPQLFKHPNFIGTIQSFVDQFLAIPFYAQKYGHLPYRIDDEIFNEKINKLASSPQYSALNYWLSQQPTRDEMLGNLRLDLNSTLISNCRLPQNTTSSYQSLLAIKNALLNDGYLCFEDAFYLAESYIKGFPRIIDLIQKRFAFVFIDEMQDTDGSQMSVIEKCFPLTAGVIIQRIGDQNQAIYGRKVQADNIWQPRQGFLKLNGSKRLSEAIASTIKNISLNPQDLVGNNRRQNIKPKIILFDDTTIKNVPGKFGELIVSHNLHENKDPIFKAIGWRKMEADAGRRTIGSYFDGYAGLIHRGRIDFENLSDYLNMDKASIEEHGFYPIRKNILNAVIKALRLEGIKKSDGVPFSSASLMDFLRDSHENTYTELNLNLYKWSCDIYNGIDRREEIKGYLTTFLRDVFSCGTITQNIQSFFAVTGNGQIRQPTNDLMPGNVFRYQSQNHHVQIEIATIHSIKGETHTGTLYLETYYQNDGGKSYESQRLIEQLKGNRVDVNCGKRVKESLKMAYVGMSRPTDLLCLAVHKAHIPDHERVNLQSNWDIIAL